MRYLCCAQCGKELPKGQSMKNWARLNVSVDQDGLRVSCVRHHMPVIQLDPVALLRLMETEPACEMCELGMPHEH